MTWPSSQYICRLFFVGLLCTVSPNCDSVNSGDRQKILAQKLSEINHLSSRSQATVLDIPEEIRSKLTKGSIEAFPSNRLELEEAATAAVPYYESDIRRFDEIAERYSEILELNINSDVNNSAQFQRQKFLKYRDATAMRKSRIELLLDRNITSKDLLFEKAAIIEKHIEVFESEINRLEMQK